MAANDPGNLMAAEIREAPDAVARQAESLRAPLAELVRHLRRHRPQVVVTCARGSSAHAATFGKHLIERTLGIPVAAAAPSIATVYRRSLTLSGQLFLAVSQSGRSDDLVELAASAKAAGAVTAALVNAADSPLAAACDIVLPISAGPELSVAATKTVIASMSALLRLVALWAEDSRCDRRSRALARAARCRDGARLEPCSAEPCDGREPRHDRPGTDAVDRPRGRPQAQGDLEPACRGLQRRRVPARPGLARFEPVSDPDADAER